MSEKRIGFIGTGVMGTGMIRNLIAAGYSVSVYNRTRSKAEALKADEVEVCDTPAELAAVSSVLISIVGYPSDVEDLYLGSGQVLEALPEGALAIDMTTSSPALAKTLAGRGKELGIEVLDAPVSGGDKGAKEGTLSIMVGGAKGAFERAMPILSAMGGNIVYQGEAGSGQYTKMCNQITIAGGMVALKEAFQFAKAAGLDSKTVLQSIGAGAAGSWSMSNLVPRAMSGDYAPGFFVKHFIKDMGIALSSAEEMGLELPGLKQAKALYDELAANGRENDGTQALFRIAFG